MPEQDDTQDTSDMSIGNLTKDDALQEIGRIVGFRGYSRTQLRKEDLNSVYWYLTGQTVADWRNLGTSDAPTYILLRKAVADEVDFDYRDSWVQSRPFRVNELQEIARELRFRDDHRQHSNDS